MPHTTTDDLLRRLQSGVLLHTRHTFRCPADSARLIEVDVVIGTDSAYRLRFGPDDPRQWSVHRIGQFSVRVSITC